MKLVWRSLGWGLFFLFISLCCYPFVWMLLSSFKDNKEIFIPNQFWPNSWNTFAWDLLLKSELLDWKRGLFNALLLSFGQTILACAMGFAFAFQLYFMEGTKKLILTLCAVAAVVMPVQVMAIPLVQITQKLGLYDTPWSVVLSGAASGLGVVYFIQAFKRIPKSLLDAAAIDGASQRHLFYLFLLESKSHLLGFLLLYFILSWHAHLLPLLLLHSEHQLPLPLSMRSLLDSSLRFPRAVLMAASTFLILPPLLFLLMGYRALKNSLGDVLNDPEV
jgi:ABC-type glycerol-3-phosphate transport system permease component